MHCNSNNGALLCRNLTKMEGEVVRLNRPALADFLRTVTSKAPRAVSADSFRPAASAKLYAEVGCSSPCVMLFKTRCALEMSRGCACSCLPTSQEHIALYGQAQQRLQQQGMPSSHFS